MSRFRMDHGGAGKDRVFCSFHDHLVGRAPSALLGLVGPKLFADAGHCRLRTVLRVRGIRPVVGMTRGHSKPDHAGGWLWGRGGQPVQPVGWRHLRIRSEEGQKDGQQNQSIENPQDCEDRQDSKEIP